MSAYACACVCVCVCVCGRSGGYDGAVWVDDSQKHCVYLQQMWCSGGLLSFSSPLHATLSLLSSCLPLFLIAFVPFHLFSALYFSSFYYVFFPSFFILVLLILFDPPHPFSILRPLLVCVTAPYEVATAEYPCTCTQTRKCARFACICTKPILSWRSAVCITHG